MNDDQIFDMVNSLPENQPGPARDYAVEARMILQGLTGMIVEKAHLEALDEYYQSEIIKLVHDIDQVTHATLKRN